MNASIPCYVRRVAMGAFVVGLAACLAGCSAKQTYGGLQQGAKNDCAMSPNSSEYALCMERASMSYEEYEQARKEQSDRGR